MHASLLNLESTAKRSFNRELDSLGIFGKIIHCSLVHSVLKTTLSVEIIKTTTNSHIIALEYLGP